MKFRFAPRTLILVCVLVLLTSLVVSLPVAAAGAPALETAPRLKAPPSPLPDATLLPISGTVTVAGNGLAQVTITAHATAHIYNAVSANDGTFTIHAPSGATITALTAVRGGYTFTYTGAGSFPLTLNAGLSGQNFSAAQNTRGTLAVAGGQTHTCALTTTGGVKCWGNNMFGQLGNGTNDSYNFPVVVKNQDGAVLSNVVDISAGTNHTCALTSTGGVKCWGRNNYGQLGDETNTARNTPVDVTGLADAVAVSGGFNHTCALTGAGGVKCWGDNQYGQLGDGTSSNHATPVNVKNSDGTTLSGITAISSGSNHTCAVTTAGGVKCWGRNTDGQLGIGTVADPPIPLYPVDVKNQDLTLLGNAVAIDSGDRFTCALTSAGGVKCWGNNLHGQTGNGTTTTPQLTAVDVIDLSDAMAISSGDYHACALTTTDAVKCWGYNHYGQLGEGSFTESILTPVSVNDLDNITAISNGGYHTCAINNNGGVKCWGWGTYGQLGNGNNTNLAVPADVLMQSISGTLTANAPSGVTITFDTGGTEFGTISAADGSYTLPTPYNIPGMLTAAKTGLSFVYTGDKTLPQAVLTDWSGQNFSEAFTISGKLTLIGTSDHSGAAITCGVYSDPDGSDTSGDYTIVGVPYGASCMVTPSMAGYEFDPHSTPISNISTNQTGFNFSARHVITPTTPAGAITGVSPAFEWYDGDPTPGWYQIGIENDPKGQGLWSPAGSFWMATNPNICQVVNERMLCSAYPVKSLAGGYYRWRVRSSNKPLVWSAYQGFQVKKAVYAPRGAQGVLPPNGSIQFRWAAMSKQFDTGLVNGGKKDIPADRYRIILYSGKTKFLDDPQQWYTKDSGSPAVTCTDGICSITLSSFNAPLAIGNYLWKVVPSYSYDYDAGKGAEHKTTPGAAVVGEQFSFSAAAPSNLLVGEKAAPAAASVTGLSDPYFTWDAPATLPTADKYEILIEQANPATGAWSKAKGGEFLINTPKTVKEVDTFRCNAGGKCFYYPGASATWKAGLYRWFVRYVSYPAKVYSPLAPGLTNGLTADDPNATVFRVKEPIFTPRPISPSGSNTLPFTYGLSPVFSWEADPSDSVISSTVSAKYVLSITTPKGKFSVDVAPTVCDNTICTYTLTSLPDAMTTPQKYPNNFLEYGAYSFSVKVGQLKTAGLDPTAVKNWTYGKDSVPMSFSFGPKAVTGLSVVQADPAKNPQVSWTGVDPYITTGFQVWVERYDETNAVWVKLSSVTRLKYGSGECTGFACRADFSKVKPWWTTPSASGRYRVWVLPFNTNPTYLGQAVIQEFELPLP